MNLHFNRVKRFGLAGLSLTVCGTVLLFNQLNAKADAPQSTSTDKVDDNIPTTSITDDEHQVTLRSAQFNTQMAMADANQYNVNATAVTANSDRWIGPPLLMVGWTSAAGMPTAKLTGVLIIPFWFLTIIPARN